jgi:hypothetical protein
MKLYNRLSLILILFLFLASCHTKFNGEVKPQTTKIEGYLADYLEIVDGTYKLEKDNGYIFSWIIKVKVKAKAAYTKDDYGFKDGNHGPLYLDFYDDKGTPITGFDNLASDFQDDSKLVNILKKGSGETWVTFTKFHDYEKEEYPDNIKAIAVSSKQIEKEASTSTSDNTQNSSTKTSTTSGNNEDWDKVLSDYEAYIDDYLKIIKKMNNGDMSAAGEYPALMEKAQDLDKSLKEAQGNNSLSAEQIGRMVKIETKMLKAVGEMQAEKKEN